MPQTGFLSPREDRCGIVRARILIWVALALSLALTGTSQAAILWSDLGTTLVHESGEGGDISGGLVRRDDQSTDTLYFKFHLDPLSDVSTEEYFAAFQLYEGETGRLAVGNSLKAWAYSAFNSAVTGTNNAVAGDIDLRSARPEPSAVLGVFLPYELPRRGTDNSIVFKVQYVADGDDEVTVWLNPDLGPGATEAGQSTNLITRFTANASFNEIHLRHGGGGGGWTFSDLAISTSFNALVTAGGPEPGDVSGAGYGELPLIFRSWQREQGLPQNSVRALAQTRDGYLWVGSEEGVARFDGLRFVSFGMREGLPGGPVNALCADRDGALWIATSGGGLTRWHEGRFTTLTARDGLPSDSVTALANDNAGRLWIGTEAGLVIWEEGRLSAVKTADEFKGKVVTTLYQDQHGTMWAGVKGAGVFSFADGKCTALNDVSVQGLLSDPHCLLVDRLGRIWVGAGDDFVLCRENGQWHRYRIPRHLTRPYVSALAEEADGTVWAGSVSEGLFQFKNGKLTAINASSGISDIFVQALLVDREGNLWVGTSAGLNRIRRGNLWAFGQNRGLGYGAVRGLAELTRGAILAGKPGDGLYRWNGRDFTRTSPPEAPESFLQVNALLAQKDGGCWVAGPGGLMRFHPAEGTTFALAGTNVLALAAGRAGTILAGTSGGELWQWSGGNWTARAENSKPHAITAIVQEKVGPLWIGTDGDGLHRIENQSSARFDKGNGLLSDSIRTLHLDSYGVLWIGTSGGGLSRWRDDRMDNFTAHEGLPDNTISQILEDDEERLWLGCNRGIVCVRKSDLEELAAGRTTTVYPQVYGRAEGMLSEECTSGFFPAGLKSKSGLLWFSTLKGVVAVEPRVNTTSSSPPSVLLEEVLLDGSSAADWQAFVTTELASNESAPHPNQAPQSLRIPPGRHMLELRYTGLNFAAPEHVRFRYQLEGLDSDWVEAGGRRTAIYSYVPPGNYNFRVVACNADGSWNQTGIALAFLVMPHFWQTWWFIGSSSLGLLFLVGGIVRGVEKRKTQRHLRRMEQEQALQRERARIAEDLHDDLGSSLARISLLSGLISADTQHPGQVEMHAKNISQSADETVRALEEIVWAVRPGSDSLQSLVEYIAHFANELFADSATRCRLDLPHDLPARTLPPEMRHNIFLIVKEALTNVFRHASAKEVQVRAKATPRSLEIVVQDDGEGFVPQSASPGHGSTNMRNRAAALGGRLTTETKPGAGTRVQLEVEFPAMEEKGKI